MTTRLQLLTCPQAHASPRCLLSSAMNHARSCSVIALPWLSMTPSAAFARLGGRMAHQRRSASDRSSCYTSHPAQLRQPGTKQAVTMRSPETLLKRFAAHAVAGLLGAALIRLQTRPVTSVDALHTKRYLPSCGWTHRSLNLRCTRARDRYAMSFPATITAWYGNTVRCLTSATERHCAAQDAVVQFCRRPASTTRPGAQGGVSIRRRVTASTIHIRIPGMSEFQRAVWHRLSASLGIPWGSIVGKAARPQHFSGPCLRASHRLPLEVVKCQSTAPR